jgi:hypothetical protein
MEQTKPTTKQIEGTIQIVKAVADAIRELKEVPSGHLYAQLMGHMSLETYNQIIGLLKRADLIIEKNYLISWKGGF